MNAERGDNPGEVVLRWGYNPRAVGQARAELRNALASWGHAAVEDAATLVLSELLTNAQRHARVPGREIETRFLRLAGDGGDGVRLEVHDASARRPQPRQEVLDACEGRGLALVDGVADRWGVTERPGPGKSVWAECTQVLR
ncbi:ATP-binding protein [Streptomyces sp. NBC_00237]|uniref:ATP-binding protein n=1 Tax=Streptomyces sp. NBC_00237 TaxID=2975687 RepID=UPI00225995D2|nr:ATP-binding protein [Streptomyces sp. NBC_00237]MCX5205006.1 ATP-binding protein [Streptomyces sp. NBC_00237]